MIPTILFVSKQLQVRLSAIKFYCQRAREDFSLVFLREIARPCERLEILREKLRATTLKSESPVLTWSVKFRLQKPIGCGTMIHNNNEKGLKT